MYCSRCATPLSESDIYCPKCSKPIASFHVSDRIPQVEPSEETPTVVHPRPAIRRPVWPAALIGALAGSIVTLAIGGVAFLLFLRWERETQNRAASTVNAIAKASESPKPTPSPTETPEPTPTPDPRVLIVNRQFPVPAGESVTFTFDATAESRVTGGFVGYGGSGEIDVVLLDDNGEVFYNNGRTSRGKINVTVPEGHYTLVFDNRRAWLTDKSIAAEIYFQAK